MESKVKTKNENNSVKIHTRKKTKYLIKRSDGLYEQTGLGAGLWCEDIVRARQYDGYSFARASIERYEEYIKDYKYDIVKADITVKISETIV
jgi:hypothetical protein